MLPLCWPPVSTHVHPCPLLSERISMKLTVSDVAGLLNVSEKTIYRWVKQGKLPAYRISEQYRFNHAELMEWATAQRIQMTPQPIAEPSTLEEPTPGLAEALRRGGISYRLSGTTKREVLRSLVEVMNLPASIDHKLLVQGFLARESLASTGIGNGIAIPHVRGPIVMHVERPILALGFLEEPIEFGAVDGKPVHILFSLICPTVRAHLRTLSHLSFMLQKPEFMGVIQRHALRDDILSTLGALEQPPKIDHPGDSQEIATRPDTQRADA